MEQLIHLLVMVVIFAIIAYGLWWVCEVCASSSGDVDCRRDSVDFPALLHRRAGWRRRWFAVSVAPVDWPWRAPDLIGYLIAR